MNQLIDITRKENFDTYKMSQKMATLLESFAVAANIEGIPVLGFHGKSLPHFSALPAEQQHLTYKYFRDYYLTCVDVTEEFGTLVDHRRHLLVALKRFDYQYPSDLLDKIQEGDVFEIYSSEGIQIFRSLNFFELVSYTLEEIFCLPWPQLYERNAFTHKSNVDAVNKVMHMNELKVLQPNIPNHWVYEKISTLKFETHIKHRYMAPIRKFGDKKVCGFINAFQILEKNHESFKLDIFSSI